MTKFKVGDRVRRSNNFLPHAPQGFEATVRNNGMIIDAEGDEIFPIVDFWERVEPTPTFDRAAFRDAAALAALTGLVQRCETNERGILYQPKILARNAYVLADAMIEARGK